MFSSLKLPKLKLPFTSDAPDKVEKEKSRKKFGRLQSFVLRL